MMRFLGAVVLLVAAIVPAAAQRGTPTLQIDSSGAIRCVYVVDLTKPGADKGVLTGCIDTTDHTWAPASAVVGPSTTTIGDIATWANTSGTLLQDTPVLSAAQLPNDLGVKTLDSGSTVFNNSADANFFIFAPTGHFAQTIYQIAGVNQSALGTAPGETFFVFDNVNSQNIIASDMSGNVSVGEIGKSLALNGSSVATALLSFSGRTSGAITIQPQEAAGTYNFNLPTTAGASGQVLTSGGGSSSPMTWTTPNTLSGTTIASLPTCTSGNKGLSMYVTNAQTSPTYLGAVSTTGAVTAPVFCNGSGWVYH